MPSPVISDAFYIARSILVKCWNLSLSLVAGDPIEPVHYPSTAGLDIDYGDAGVPAAIHGETVAP